LAVEFSGLQLCGSNPLEVGGMESEMGVMGWSEMVSFEMMREILR